MPESVHRSLRLLSCLTVGLSLVACSRSSDPAASGPKGPPIVPVVVAQVAQRSMPVELPAMGNVRAMASVAVKSRVSGQVAKVNFKEGQDVKAGDVLAEIDPAPFEVVLNKAKAQLAQARTQAEIAAKQAGRYSSLVNKGAVAQEEVDQLKSAADAAKSNQLAAEAAVAEAQLQLDYCQVKSPIAGRAGRRVVDAGNVVKADETDLVVVNQLRPIEVIFSLPEQYLGEVQRYAAQGQLKVSIKPSGGALRNIDGALSFIDNTVKTATGTIEAKATMENEDLALWPGQFGEIRLTLTTEPNALVVPATAVQTGQDGQYVFVIKSDMTAEYRPVVMERTVGLDAVIRSGLTAGEQVVVDGQLRLAPGTKVELKPPVDGSQTANQVAKGAALP